MKKGQVAITLGIMCMLLTVAIVIQINTIKDANTVVGVSRVESELKDQVLEERENYDKLYKKLEEKEKDLEENLKYDSVLAKKHYLEHKDDEVFYPFLS